MDDKLKRQMAGQLSVQLRGILSKSWHSRYCVFLIEVNGNSPQIHVFEKEEHYRKKSKDKKVFHLDSVKRLQLMKDKLLGFEIITKKDKFCFAAENDHDLKLWMNTLKLDLRTSIAHEQDGIVPSDDDESDSHLYMDDNIIYESAEVAPMFSVTIDDNEAAKRCNLSGTYFLVVNFHNLALVDSDTKKAIYQWPFKYIRRFGKTRTNFQFEAGRKCPSGEGEFSFKTHQGFEIFDTFSKTTQKIRSQEDTPVNALKVSGGSAQVEHHGHVQSKADTRVSPTSFERGQSEIHQPLSSSQGDRRSVKSSGHIGPVPEKFASELNNALTKHKDPEHNLPVGKPASPSTAEHIHEEVKTGKKDKHKGDKKAQEKAEKTEKKPKKGKEKKEEKKEEKKSEKKEEKKSEKKSEKKKVRPTVSGPMAVGQACGHAYEEVDEIANRRISGHAGAGPLYTEASETSKKPTPMPKPRMDPKKTTEEKPDTVLYAEPQKLKKDAWKQHGREVEEHLEDYDLIKNVATSGRSGAPKHPEADYDLPVDSGAQAQIVEEDETYDHIGNVNLKLKQDEPEGLYGTASGKSITSIKKSMGEIHDYEEAIVDSSTKMKAVTAKRNEYDEPSMKQVALPSRNEEEEDEESAYAAID